MIVCIVGVLDHDARIFLTSKLESNLTELRFLPTLQELIVALEGLAASGILLEVATAVKASPFQKKTIQELTELYTLAKFRLFEEKILIPGKSVEDFLVDCRKCQPRPLRKDLRRQEYLAVYLYSHISSADCERGVTLNISDRGCFVYSAREWTIGDSVWLRFEGDEIVHKGVVKSRIPWGNNKRLPGIGIQFDSSGFDSSLPLNRVKIQP